MLKEQGFELEIVTDYYFYGHNPSFQLVIKEVLDPDYDDYFPGESWDTVSVNLPGLKKDEVALNHDFSSYSSPELVEEVLKEITTDSTPVRYIQSGFVNFPVYKVKTKYIK